MVKVAGYSARFVDLSDQEKEELINRPRSAWQRTDPGPPPEGTTPMPIYEFYCRQCHTIYSFLSRSVNTARVPVCPTGPRHRLQRQVSGFAVVSGGKARGRGRGRLPGRRYPHGAGHGDPGL